MSPRLNETRTFLKNAGPPMQNLEDFRDIARWSLKVYLSMEAESVIGVSNSCDLAWLGAARSEYFPNKLQFHMEGTHIEVTTLQRNAYFI